MGRRPTGRDAPSAVSAAQLRAATGWAALALPAGGPGTAGVDATGVVAVVVLGVFGTGATFYLDYRLIEDEGATRAATVGHLLPVVSVTPGALFLDERVGMRVVAGMVVVLTGSGTDTAGHEGGGRRGSRGRGPGSRRGHDRRCRGPGPRGGEPHGDRGPGLPPLRGESRLPLRSAFPAGPGAAAAVRLTPRRTAPPPRPERVG
jgi:hypothetical protein